MNRRGIVLGSVAAAAVVAGVGAGVWRARSSAGAPASAPDLWTLSFATVDGPPLAMSGLRGRHVLVNFWATWCPPCVTEMPLLDAFAKSQADAGWSVLALAIDGAEPVRRFIVERSLKLPVALAGDDGIDLSRRLGNSAGGLPFSVAFDREGMPVQRRLGAIDAELLRTWAAATA